MRVSALDFPDVTETNGTRLCLIAMVSKAFARLAVDRTGSLRSSRARVEHSKTGVTASMGFVANIRRAARYARGLFRLLKRIKPIELDSDLSLIHI